MVWAILQLKKREDLSEKWLVWLWLFFLRACATDTGGSFTCQSPGSNSSTSDLILVFGQVLVATTVTYFFMACSQEARLAQSVEHETLNSQEWSQGRGFEPHVGRPLSELMTIWWSRRCSSINTRHFREKKLQRSSVFFCWSFNWKEKVFWGLACQFDRNFSSPFPQEIQSTSPTTTFYNCYFKALLSMLVLSLFFRNVSAAQSLRIHEFTQHNIWSAEMLAGPHTKHG